MCRTCPNTRQYNVIPAAHISTALPPNFWEPKREGGGVNNTFARILGLPSKVSGAKNAGVPADLWSWASESSDAHCSDTPKSAIYQKLINARLWLI